MKGVKPKKNPTNRRRNACRKVLKVWYNGKQAIAGNTAQSRAEHVFNGENPIIFPFWPYEKREQVEAEE
jgi:hypothetical protein